MADSVLVVRFKQGYSAVFERNWPLWAGGLLLGLFSILLAAWGRPWGVVGGLRIWGDWLLFGVGLAARPQADPFLSDGAILTWGLLLGAFGSALLSHQWSLTKAPAWELLKGAVGGILLGLGSALAGGCNVGGFFTPLAAGSVSGFAMMLGLTMGAVLGLKYLLWEIEHIPSKSSAPLMAKAGGGVNWDKVQPWLGAGFFLALIVLAYVMALHAYTRAGVMLLLTAGVGMVIQRCRFCFVRAFRDPFMTGESVATKAVALSVMVATAGTLLLKWNGTLGENVYVYHHWIGGLLGGTIFGFGMLLTGGCGSGSVWRAAEGQVKLIVVVIFFALSNSVFRGRVFTNEVLERLGATIYLPAVTDYFWALLITCLVMIGWWGLMAWNEETDKLTIT